MRMMAKQKMNDEFVELTDEISGCQAQLSLARERLAEEEAVDTCFRLKNGEILPF